MKPLGIDLFCGLGGWSEGLLAEGYRVVGFDNERHEYGEHRYPGKLVLQDVRTLDGAQFKDAALLVASPPCQSYSYMAMPWSRAKARVAYYSEPGHPERLAELNELFDACSRIQREASAAAGRHVPLIVENVVGAQKWVGPARWRYGSFYLWGDVPALMPIVRSRLAKVPGADFSKFAQTGEVSPYWRLEGLKNGGGSWFNVAHNTTRGKGRNPDGLAPPDGIKIGDRNVHRATGGHKWSSHWTEGKKSAGWFGPDNPSSMRQHSSNSKKRKAASALIAKIPFELARHCAACWKPTELRETGSD